MTLPILTQEDIKALVDYDPETGMFSKNGLAIGHYTYGYLRLYLRKNNYQAHRIAWTYVHGDWVFPNVVVDHMNGIRHDNRIANLRLATHTENMQNKLKPQGKNPFLGVTKEQFSDKWRASIYSNGKRIHLGYAFSTPEDARDAYLKAKRELHSGFLG
jgi:hypothetical protein